MILWMGWTVALGVPYLELIDAMTRKGPPMFRTLCSHCFRALLVCNGHNENAPAIPRRGRDGDDLWEAGARACRAPQSASHPDPARGRRKGKAARRALSR
jgi:hypothetical protein